MERQMISGGKAGKHPTLILFTDLDGTLLDSGYSFKEALPALELVRSKNIPLVICTSKTRQEIEVVRTQLGNDHPFISENGGGIYLPKENFKFQISDSKYKVEEIEGYYLIKLGADYADLRKALNAIKEEGFDVRGFGDMSPAEVAELTGLKEADAVLAKKRDFDETFVFDGDEASVAKLKQAVVSKGFNYTQGEYFHIMGNSDKGRAVSIVKDLYETEGLKVTTAAFGDSPNDIEMLNIVDRPYIVKKEDGSYNRQVLDKVKGCIKVEGIGPVGWNRAVLELIHEFE